MTANIFLQELQDNLEALYRLDPAPKVTEFLLLQETTQREQLLLLEEQDLYLCLVLDPLVMVKLQGNCLDTENFSEFCLAVEGVSHFLFIIFCARQQRHVTLLEVELQGEVDKYLASILLANRSKQLTPEAIFQSLYHTFHLIDGLDAATRHRYQNASSLASYYIRALEQRFIQQRRFAAMMRELREFYRMGYQRKRELIVGR